MSGVMLFVMLFVVRFMVFLFDHLVRFWSSAFRFSRSGVGYRSFWAGFSHCDCPESAAHGKRGRKAPNDLFGIHGVYVLEIERLV